MVVMVASIVMTNGVTISVFLIYSLPKRNEIRIFRNKIRKAKVFGRIR
jgi:hypothetical protein